MPDIVFDGIQDDRVDGNWKKKVFATCLQHDHPVSDKNRVRALTKAKLVAVLARSPDRAQPNPGGQPIPDYGEFIIGPARWQAPAGPGGSIRATKGEVRIG